MTVVAVLGGTFDPVHVGHLAVADQVARALPAAEVWLVPSRIPPHRAPAQATAEARLALLRAAAAGDPRLRVLDLEVRREGPSYTADTLDALEAAHPEVELWWVLGADAARDIGVWHRREELLRRARFVLVNRAGSAPLEAAELAALGFEPPRTLLLAIDSPDVSSSEVRRRLHARLPVDDLVPAPVLPLLHGAYAGPP